MPSRLAFYLLFAFDKQNARKPQAASNTVSIEHSTVGAEVSNILLVYKSKNIGFSTHGLYEHIQTNSYFGPLSVVLLAGGSVTSGAPAVPRAGAAWRAAYSRQLPVVVALKPVAIATAPPSLPRPPPPPVHY
jgi:hypothetical protein